MYISLNTAKKNFEQQEGSNSHTLMWILDS